MKDTIDVWNIYTLLATMGPSEVLMVYCPPMGERGKRAGELTLQHGG